MVRQCQVHVGRVRTCGAAFGIALQSTAVSKVISSSGLVAAILNPQSTMSGDIDAVIFGSVPVENMGVSVGIIYVCRWKLKLHRPSENLRFFHERCPWFSKSVQVPERAAFMRKTPKDPEFIP